MPALGAPELIIILVIIILIFGVGKLPEVGSALGKGIREFRKTADEADQKPEPAEPTAPVAAVEAPRQAAVEAPRQAAVEAPRQAPAEAPRPQVTTTMAYTVQNGDTLDGVAQRHSVTVEELMRANGYSQRDRVLYAGDQLQIPRAPSSAA